MLFPWGQDSSLSAALLAAARRERIRKLIPQIRTVQRKSSRNRVEYPRMYLELSAWFGEIRSINFEKINKATFSFSHICGNLYYIPIYESWNLYETISCNDPGLPASRRFRMLYVGCSETFQEKPSGIPRSGRSSAYRPVYEIPWIKSDRGRIPADEED